MKLQAEVVLGSARSEGTTTVTAGPSPSRGLWRVSSFPLVFAFCSFVHFFLTVIQNLTLMNGFLSKCCEPSFPIHKT